MDSVKSGQKTYYLLLAAFMHELTADPIRVSFSYTTLDLPREPHHYEVLPRPQGNYCPPKLRFHICRWLKEALVVRPHHSATARDRPVSSFSHTSPLVSNHCLAIIDMITPLVHRCHFQTDLRIIQPKQGRGISDSQPRRKHHTYSQCGFSSAP